MDIQNSLGEGGKGGKGGRAASIVDIIRVLTNFIYFMTVAI
jgi:transposase-like protein